MKRAFDVFLALLSLIILLPLFIIISILVLLGSQGGIIYAQIRIGKGRKPFRLYKFRTMRPFADRSGQLTIGSNDPRITKTGYFLRNYKLDELPQLINIIKGDMSFVGPRPEVPEYVDLYNERQRNVLTVKPGLTDYASIQYINENDILGRAADPVKTYCETIMPAKLELNIKYIDDQSFMLDLAILLKTIKAIFQSSNN